MNSEKINEILAAKYGNPIPPGELNELERKRAEGRASEEDLLRLEKNSKRAQEKIKLNATNLTGDELLRSTSSAVGTISTSLDYLQTAARTNTRRTKAMDEGPPASRKARRDRKNNFNKQWKNAAYTIWYNDQEDNETMPQSVEIVADQLAQEHNKKYKDKREPGTIQNAIKGVKARATTDARLKLRRHTY